MNTFFNRVLNVCSLFSGITITVIAFIMCYDVVLRYFFLSPTYWADEVCEYIIVWSVFLGMAWVVRENAHIRVEIVFDRVSVKWQGIFNIISTILVLLFFITFFYVSAKMCLKSFQLNFTSISPLHMPMFIPQLSLVIGGFIVILQLLNNLIHGDKHS